MKALTYCLSLAVAACGGSGSTGTPVPAGAVESRALEMAHDMCQTHGGLTAAHSTLVGGLVVSLDAMCLDGEQVSIPV